MMYLVLKDCTLKGHFEELISDYTPGWGTYTHCTEKTFTIGNIIEGKTISEDTFETYSSNTFKSFLDINIQELVNQGILREMNPREYNRVIRYQKMTKEYNSLLAHMSYLYTCCLNEDNITEDYMVEYEKCIRHEIKLNTKIKIATMGLKHAVQNHLSYSNIFETF